MREVFSLQALSDFSDSQKFMAGCLALIIVVAVLSAAIGLYRFGA